MKIICPDGNGYAYYVQAVDESRYIRARGVETFIVKAGDYWNGPEGSDAANFRERCEARVTTEDAIGSTWRYQFHLQIPQDYPEYSPKQTLGQWHNGTYDTVFNRYEAGVFTICLNNKEAGSFVEYQTPLNKGVWNTFGYTFTWHASRGAIAASVNGRTVVKETGIPLVPAATQSMHFKYGIYRNMRAGLVGPVQQASYRLVSRAAG